MKAALLALSFVALIGVGLCAETGAAPESATESAPEQTGPLACFQCNSHQDPECGDDFDDQNLAIRKAFLRPCTTGTFCKKVKMWFDLNGETRVMRGCGTNKRDYPKACYQSRADDHIEDTCQCDGMECNASPPTATPAFLGVFSAALVAFRG